MDLPLPRLTWAVPLQGSKTTTLQAPSLFRKLSQWGKVDLTLHVKVKGGCEGGGATPMAHDPLSLILSLIEPAPPPLSDPGKGSYLATENSI